MCYNNNNGLCGGCNIWWIIILLVLFCGCGNTGFGNYGGNGCGCDTRC